jgi:Fe-S cluster assembly protein SufD
MSNVMEAEAAPPDSLRTAGLILEGPCARANETSSPWLQELQKRGWEDFTRLPMPVRTNEEWRFGNVKALNLEPYVSPLPVSDEDRETLIARSRGVERSAGRMIFANDQLLRHDVYSDALAEQGVIWAPIETAAAEHAEIFQRHFMTQDVVLGSAKFAALHRAFVKSGTFLFVPANVELKMPLEVFHWLCGENGSTFPHTLLIAGRHSKVTLVDYFESRDKFSPGLACGMNDLILEAGATLTYVCFQNWSRETLAFQINSTLVNRDAHATSMNLNLGARYARAESVSKLIGPGSRSDMLAVSVADGNQQFDQRTLQDHQQPNTQSDLLYKNALNDTARTIFSGLIKVEPHAHQTDAYQTVRNLLLSDDAEANSMPGLEILADDVRCSHGATSGQIEEEELFYLKSRGISDEAAKGLIVFGFLNDAIERLDDASVKEQLRSRVHEKFLQRA